MFTRKELDIITRALTGYENDLKEVIGAIEDCQFEEDKGLIEGFHRRLEEVEAIHYKTMEIKWRILHGRNKED